MKRLQKFLIGLLIILMLVVGGTWIAGQMARTKLAERFPPPGRLVDIGGYRLHLYCVGQGPDTVMFESDLNEFSVQWTDLQGTVAKYARACAYDRAGLGWSDASPLPRTGQNMVMELHTLLDRAGIRGPLVLVGHSFGGLLAREYIQTYPAEVSGLVLVDAAHADQLARIPELSKGIRKNVHDFRTLGWISRFGLMALSREGAPAHELRGEALARYRAVLATTGYFKAAMAESAAFEQNLAEARALQLGSLGALPLAVVSRGRDDALPYLTPEEQAHCEKEWCSLQTQLTALSSNSKQLTAARSGHYLHLTEPEVVDFAISDVISRITPSMPAAPAAGFGKASS